jgi:2-(1,2-epoxy-1,2-dihydrophenyl)acetyl-CoA isomerase
MFSDLEFIKVDLVDSVATITLNRPDKFHSFIRKMSLEMHQALDFARENEHVRCVLITATGKAFCAGQDLSEAIDPNGPEISRIVSEHYNPMIQRIRSLEKPVVCGVNGVAAGAGASLAIACDVVVACQSATFIQAFSKIGLIPDSGATYFLPRLVGLQRAAALMFLADKITAQEAQAMGMIYKVFEDDVFAIKTFELARRLAQMPTKAIGYTKRALNQSLTNNLDAQLAVEDMLQGAAGLTQDYREGVQAFLEKRNPSFTGK